MEFKGITKPESYMKPGLDTTAKRNLHYGPGHQSLISIPGSIIDKKNF